MEKWKASRWVRPAAHGQLREGNDMQLVETDGGFDLILAGRSILRHRSDAPCLYVGRGNPRVEMYHGHFDIEDNIEERVGLRHATLTCDHNGSARIALSIASSLPPLVTLTLSGGA